MAALIRRRAAVAALAAILLTLALLGAGGCGGPPAVSLEQVSSATISTLSSDRTPDWTPRAATEAEIRRFVDAYAHAGDFDDSVGATHRVRVEVILRSGARIQVSGGDEGFQSVSKGNGHWNIASRELERMLRAIRDEGGEGQ